MLLGSYDVVVYPSSKAAFTYGLVWAASQGPPSSKTINKYINTGGGGGGGEGGGNIHKGYPNSISLLKALPS